MKKLAFAVIVVVLIVLGLWYVKHHHTVKVVSTTATYKNLDMGLSFTYPKILTVTDSDNANNTIVNVHHEIPFSHRDYCDFKGDENNGNIATSTPTLTDFNMTMHVDNLTLTDAMRAESPYIPTENFVNEQVVPSPGFIDPVTYGKLSGYVVTEGAEGCGQNIYFLTVSGSKTLVVTDDIITVFTGAIDPSQATAALAIPGVISKPDHNQILNSILQSLSVN